MTYIRELLSRRTMWLLAVPLVTVGGATAASRALASDTAEMRQTIAVMVTNDAITVKPASVRPGEHMFSVTNRTSVPYDVEVKGPHGDKDLEDIPAGATRTMKMMLSAGQYRIDSEAERGPKNKHHTMLNVHM